MEFDPSSNELSWSIDFSDLSGSATAAHFHGPAAEGANAGVQVNIGEVSGLVSPMNGSAQLTPDQASALLDGQLYINIHTAANPDGEIRGQVSCESPAPGDGSEETATVVIGDQEFDIQYTINGGTVDEVTADPALQTLLITISSTSDGNLTLWLPTELIDTDDEFSVFVDGEFGNFAVDELDPTADARVLQIEFENGAEEIEIVGTFIVPEFGTLAIVVISIAIMGTIIATTRFHKFGGLQQ
jgi:predicted secreted protein with PEFG-CTERM motif